LRQGRLYYILGVELLDYFKNLRFAIREVSFGSKTMRDYRKAVIDFSSHLLSRDGADVSLSEAAEDLDLPFLTVFRDSSVAGSSFAA
jgi:hypothetical protein